MAVAGAEYAVQMVELVAAGIEMEIEVEVAVAFVLVVHKDLVVEVAQVAAEDEVLQLAIVDIFLVEVVVVGIAWAGLLGSPAHRNSDLQ
jgi:hypothetical protein